jgi:DNA polymerase-3 subunit beta
VKTSVERDVFNSVLRRVAPLAPDVSTIPIIGTVRLEAGTDGLAATTSDLDRWLTERVDDKPREPWAGCVAAERIHDLIKSLPGGGDIALDADDRELTLVSGSVTARLGVLPPDDFPRVWQRSDEPAVVSEIEAAALLPALKFCGHVCLPDNEATQHFHLGVHFGEDGVLAGTDGRRMAVQRLTGLRAPPGGVIIPAPTCRRLQALLRETEGLVAVTLTPRLAAFAGGQWQLTAKTIDGAFPDYESALPLRSHGPAVVDREALAAATRRVKLMCFGEKTHGLRLGVDKNELTVSGSSPEAAINEVIPLAGIIGGTMVAVNALFLDKALEVIECDRVELHLKGQHDGFWLCAAGEDYDGIVLTPMRL